MKEFSFSYRWQYECVSSPDELWIRLSDTNRLFKDMGQLPVQPAHFTHDKEEGCRELTYEPLHRTDIWQEEPYQWEAPYHLSVKRNYKNGPYKDLLIHIDLAPKNDGTTVIVSFKGTATGIAGWFFTKRSFGNRFRRKVKKIITVCDAASRNANLPEIRKRSRLPGKTNRWNLLKEKLTEISNNPEISSLLIDTIKNADETNLTAMQATHLAEIWGKPRYPVLEVMLFAAKINVLNFSWDLACPECRKTIKNSKKLSEISESVFCPDCNLDADLDFSHTIRIVFQPHPLVRKLSKKTYCLGNPALQPHVKLHQKLHPAQKKFVKIDLSPGDYTFYCNKTDSKVTAVVEPGGIDNATLTFSKNDNIAQRVVLSPQPNLILNNQTDQSIHIVCEDNNWTRYGTSASYLTSLQTFRNLFPGELIRPGKKIQAKDLTILFTDLYNSSHLYSSDGDDAAIGQVIDHFETINKIFTAEQGAIVKTIGDAVMAVFPKPVYAVRAFHEAQNQFRKKTSGRYPMQLKAGIHSGNCIAVTLNNRIDFFGNTVNIASRLVEQAGSGELVISDEAYNSAELKKFLSLHKSNLRIHHFDISLRGFEDHLFEAKKITLQAGSLRLVV